MIKLKPIAEQILQESEKMPTWGEVQKVFAAIVGKQNDKEIKDNLGKLAKSGSTLALTFLTGGMYSLVDTTLKVVDTVNSIADVAKAVVTLGKAASENQLKNPERSEFKKLTAPFWDAIRIDPEISAILDDQLESEFINTQIVPKLQKGGNESEEIPNMNYELGKWLNDKQKLKDKDIFFKGKTVNL
jgi:hypothetical protein